MYNMYMLYMYMSYYNYILFFPMIILTNLMMMISSSWFSMWMIMEINLISFISLISFDNNIKHEILMNYFLIQVFNSFMFLMSMIMMNYLNFYQISIMLMNFSMLMKLGMPPLFMWYLKIMKEMNWMSIFIMSTLQKIIPLIILNNIINNKYSMILLMLIMILSSIYIPILGMNSSNLKIIISYSSMIQMSWIIMNLMVNEMIAINYFMIYMLISMNLMMIFYIMSCKFLINLYMLKFNNNNLLYFINFMIFSLAAMPPMFGFMMKLISIQSMSNYINFMILLLLIMGSLMSMFFYLRLLYYNIMMNSMSLKFSIKFINFQNNMNYKIIYSSWLLLWLLLIYELL
nr:NADH dehydrogenase subunit 2 [Walkerella microcarpae]